MQQERFYLQCNYATTPLSRVVAYANSKQRTYITIGEGRYTISRILGRLTSTIHIVGCFPATFLYLCVNDCFYQTPYR